MVEIFKAKLRKIGNSVGIIIPKDILHDIGADKDDTIYVTVPNSKIETRNNQLLSLAGIDLGKPAFKRDKKDRF